MASIEKSKEDARNLNELTDHLIKLIESDSKRFSFEFCTCGTMEIYDKEKEIGYAVHIAPIEYDEDGMSKSHINILKGWNKTTIDILGTKYKVAKEVFKDADEDGYCDYTSKEICIRKDNYYDVGNFNYLQQKQLRHEIIHAFLAESGLQSNFKHPDEFGHDETMVYWIAIQWHKIEKVFNQLGI